MLLNLLLACFMFLSILLEGSEALSFNDLILHDTSQSSYHHREVKIRGFLYYTQEKGWILAPEPNLKSCCLGNLEKINQQIFVSEMPTLKQSNQAVVVEGTYQRKLVEGRWIHQLANARILEETKSYWSLGVFVLGMIAFSLYKLKRGGMRTIEGLNRHS